MESAPFNPLPPGDPYASPQAAQEARPPEPPGKLPVWLPLAALGAVMLVANVTVTPLMYAFSKNDWGALWVFMCFGVICAEGGVLSAALVWGPGSFLIRLALHWMAVVVLFLAWFIGAAANESRPSNIPEEEIAMAFFSLPLLALAIQLPLWGMRSLFGWRITVHDEAAPVPAEPPLTIRDLMLATVLVAVAFTSARIVKSLNPSESEYWLIWTAVTGVAFGISTLSVLPVAWWMLRWPRGVGGLLLAALYAVAAATAISVVMRFISRSINVWDVVGTSTILVACGLMLALTGLAAHRAGYRLQVGRGRAAL